MEGMLLYQICVFPAGEAEKELLQDHYTGKNRRCQQFFADAKKSRRNRHLRSSWLTHGILFEITQKISGK